MLNEQGPAGQGLARIEFPRGFKDDGAGIDLLHQLTRQPSRIVPFGRAQRGGLPFRAIGIQGDERGFAAHGESRIVIAGEVGDAKQHGIGRESWRPRDFADCIFRQTPKHGCSCRAGLTGPGEGGVIFSRLASLRRGR